MIETGTSTDVPALAGGAAGAQRVRELVSVALDAVAEAAAARTGPIPAGGPPGVATALAGALAGPGVLPEHGVGQSRALGELTRLLTAGSVDPAHPWCAAHLHGPTLAVAAAADLVASMLNPSMDSWDQAPIASELERELTAALARLCYPAEPVPDAVITSGGTESNLLGLLLAREAGARHVVRGHTAHHSIDRAAWLLGLPAPTVVDTERPDRLRLPDRAVLVATAGTTDTGTLDPLPALAAVAELAGAWLHVDASYGGALLFSERLAPLLDGLTRAGSVAVDLHKFGWQPIAAGLLAAREPITALDVRADYLNPDDDMAAGLPDLLGRSLRTSRRPDAFKIAVTLRALGRVGVGELVERCCRRATDVATAIDEHPGLRLWGRPVLSTVLFRPAAATDDQAGDHAVAEIRRGLMEQGRAVVGRATVEGRVWLKLTLLNPEGDVDGLADLLDLVAGAAVSP